MAIIDQILSILIDSEGSDIYIAAEQPARARVNGELIAVTDIPMAAEEIETIFKEICPEEKWKEFERNKEVVFSYQVGNEFRFRCKITNEISGLLGVFRNIPLEVYSLEELNTPDALRKLCRYESGLICVTGIPGCGKSTTVAAIIDFINKNYIKNIQTIESPIEYLHKNERSIITQREIGRDCKSYSDSIKTALKADVDVLFIGDVKDKNILKLAIECAAKGMLVIINLCYRNSIKTVESIIDSFDFDEQPLIRTLLAESLKAIVSQTLCRKNDGGVIAAHEILLWEDTIPNSIRNNQIRNFKSIIDSNKNMGMCLLDSNLNQFLNEGIINAKEAYMKSIDKKLFVKHTQDEE